MDVNSITSLSVAELVRYAHAMLIPLCFGGVHSIYDASTTLSQYKASTRKKGQWSQQVENQTVDMQCVHLHAASYLLANLAVVLFILLPDQLCCGLTWWMVSSVMYFMDSWATTLINRTWIRYNDPSDKDYGTRTPMPNPEQYNKAELTTGALVSYLVVVQNMWIVFAFPVGFCWLLGLF